MSQHKRENIKMQKQQEDVLQYYQATVSYYGNHYQDNFPGYPANLKRLELLLKRTRALNTRSLLDCGCGEGSPMKGFHEAGTEVWGFDFSEEMVNQAKENLESIGLRNRVWAGDITQSHSFRPEGVDLPTQVDACLAAGVFPHLSDERAALKNMASAVRPGGRVFVEFRNELFALFTLNRYSHEFFYEKLIQGERLGAEHPERRQEIEQLLEALKPHFQLDMPKHRPSPSGAPSSIDGILCQFKNPFECKELFEAEGLKVDQLHFYHFHRFPPMFEKIAPDFFRERSLELEENPQDWRGHFMASAFVVESIKQE